MNIAHAGDEPARQNEGQDGAQRDREDATNPGDKHEAVQQGCRAAGRSGGLGIDQPGPVVESPVQPIHRGRGVAGDKSGGGRGFVLRSGCRAEAGGLSLVGPPGGGGGIVVDHLGRRERQSRQCRQRVIDFAGVPRQVRRRRSPGRFVGRQQIRLQIPLVLDEPEVEFAHEARRRQRRSLDGRNVAARDGGEGHGHAAGDRHHQEGGAEGREKLELN